jgi:ADP-heptose:LPS heptosyltransferase
MSRIINDLRRLRRTLAPPASRRERWARAFYVPLAQLAPRKPRARQAHRQTEVLECRQTDVSMSTAPTAPVPELVWLGGAAVDIPGLATRPAPIARILILKLDHIGDFILGMRAMRMLREGFPDAHITLVCASWSVEWAHRLQLFDRVVAFDFFPALTREWIYSPERVEQLQNAVADLLRSDSYDLAVDLRYGEDTTPCLYRIRARYRAGFPAPIDPDLPHLDLIVPYSQRIGSGDLKARSLHAELRLQMLAATVVAAFGVPRPHPIRACLTASHQAAAQHPFAVLSIGAGTSIRMWPNERYAEVGRALIERYHFDIVILAGKAEQESAEHLAGLLPVGRTSLVINRPLAELPPLMAAASLCVSNDTGMSHLTAALDVPTVVVLSGQDLMEVWRPSGTNAVAIGGWTACQPCGLREARDCPWGVPCLRIVTSAHGLKACDQLLARVSHPTAFANATIEAPHEPTNILG